MTANCPSASRTIKTHAFLARCALGLPSRFQTRHRWRHCPDPLRDPSICPSTKPKRPRSPKRRLKTRATPTARPTAKPAACSRSTFPRSKRIGRDCARSRRRPNAAPWSRATAMAAGSSRSSAQLYHAGCTTFFVADLSEGKRARAHRAGSDHLYPQRIAARHRSGLRRALSAAGDRIDVRARRMGHVLHRADGMAASRCMSTPA